jgi:hypothetical protein
MECLDDGIARHVSRHPAFLPDLPPIGAETS